MIPIILLLAALMLLFARRIVLMVVRIWTKLALTAAALIAELATAALAEVGLIVAEDLVLAEFAGHYR
ncbi:MAG: hypothetical protein PHN44_12580 [Candidatus Marinimicrobia bacterium]|nr:hypothetical protein [Candidatus Neomarinimicrobiota bacterium]